MMSFEFPSQAMIASLGGFSVPSLTTKNIARAPQIYNYSYIYTVCFGGLTACNMISINNIGTRHANCERAALSCSVIALSGLLIASAYPFEASEQMLRLRSRRSRDRDHWDRTAPYPCRWRAPRHRGSAPEAHSVGGGSARS